MTPICNVLLPTVVLLWTCSGVFSSYVFHLTDQDFNAVLRDKDLMLVSFIAPWCEHCKELDPQLDSAATTLATTKHEFVFAKLTVESCDHQVDCQRTGRYICKMFNVQALPTLKLFKHGRYVGDYIGQTDKNSLLRYVSSVASHTAQQAPLSFGAKSQATLGQAIKPRVQAASYASHQASAPHPQAPKHAASQTPSLVSSFYGDQVKPPSIYKAAYAAGPAGAAARHSDSDTFQSKFGNLAYFEVYKSKLKMIAAYKNYEKRLHEYKDQLGNFTKAVNAAKQQNNNPAYQAYQSPQTGQTGQTGQYYPGYSSAAYAGYQTPYSYSGGYRSKLNHAKVAKQQPARSQKPHTRSFAGAWHGRTAPAQYPSAQVQQQQPGYYVTRAGGYQAAPQKAQVQQQPATVQQQQMYTSQQQQQQQQQQMYASQQQQQQQQVYASQPQQQQQQVYASQPQQQQQQQQMYASQQQQADLQRKQQQQQQQQEQQKQLQRQQQADLQEQLKKQQQQQQEQDEQQQQQEQVKQQHQGDQSEQGQSLSELLHVTAPKANKQDGDKDALQNLKNDIEDAIQDALKDTGSEDSAHQNDGGQAKDAHKYDGSGSGSGHEVEAVKGTSSDASGSGSGNGIGSGSGM